jgi:hypothetical protein
MSEDVVVGITNLIHPTSSFAKKPPHLIVLDGGKKPSLFISLDKPDFINGMTTVKGIFTDEKTEDVLKDYSKILAGTLQKLLVEVMIPQHRVQLIQNLVYAAK